MKCSDSRRRTRCARSYLPQVWLRDGWSAATGKLQRPRAHEAAGPQEIAHALVQGLPKHTRPLSVGLIVPYLERGVGGATPRWTDIRRICVCAPTRSGFDSLWLRDPVLLPLTPAG